MNSDSGIQFCEEGESSIAIDIEHPIPLNKKKEGSNNFEWKFEKEAEARTLTVRSSGNLRRAEDRFNGKCYFHQ
jgi:hypothetical protein